MLCHTFRSALCSTSSGQKHFSDYLFVCSHTDKIVEKRSLSWTFNIQVHQIKLSVELIKWTASINQQLSLSFRLIKNRRESWISCLTRRPLASTQLGRTSCTEQIRRDGTKYALGNYSACIFSDANLSDTWIMSKTLRREEVNACNPRGYVIAVASWGVSWPMLHTKKQNFHQMTCIKVPKAKHRHQKVLVLDMCSGHTGEGNQSLN